MKYLKRYNEDVRDWNRASKFTHTLDEDFIEDINDIISDLIDDNNIYLKCWLGNNFDDDDDGEEYFDWKDVDRLVPAPSISFTIYPKKVRHFLTNEEIEEFVDVVNRINDYLKTLPDDITRQIETHIHYHTRNKITMTRTNQIEIGIDKVNRLISISSSMLHGSISDISLTIVKD